MGTEANRSRRRGRATAIGLAATLVTALVATLFSIVVSAGSASAADWGVTLKMTKTDARKLALTAVASRSLPGTGYVLSIWDTTTGARVAVCNNGVTSCAGNVVSGYTSISTTVIPTASTSDLSAAAHQYAATVAPLSDTYPTDTAVATSATQTADPWTVSLTGTVINSKQITLSATTNYSIPGTGYTLAIFDQTTGTQLKACNSGDTPCEGLSSAGYYYTRTTVVPKATSTDLSAAPHQYVAILAGITDALPGDNVAATSSVVTADPWKVTLSAVQTSARTLQLTAVSNWSIPTSGYTLAIFDRTTGAQVSSCSSGDFACSGSSGVGYYWNRAVVTPRGATTDLSSVAHDYIAVIAQDATALPGVNVAATSDPVTALPWSVTLTSTPANGGQAATLSAQSSYTLPGSGYTLAVYDETTGERVGVCGTGYASCANSGGATGVAIKVGRTTGLSDSYVAVVSDDTAALPASNIAAQSTSVVPQ